MDPFYDENFYYDNYIFQTYPPFPINNKNNTKNTFKIIQAVNHLNDIDLDEVEKNITPINKEKNNSGNDVHFENMLQ